MGFLEVLKVISKNFKNGLATIFGFATLTARCSKAAAKAVRRNGLRTKKTSLTVQSVLNKKRALQRW